MKKVRRLVVPLIGVFAVVDLVLFLGVVHREWFSSLPMSDFLWVVWDAISLWSGRAITVAGVLVPILVFVFKKHWPMERTWREIFTSSWGKFSLWWEREWIVFPTFSALLVAALALTYVLCTERPQFATPASTVLITPNGSELYVITQDSQRAGEIIRYDAATTKRLLGVIDVGGTPERMLAGPRSGNIYVLDVQGDLVRVIKPNGSLGEVYFAARGKVSTSMVLTPDERKLYISNQQPSPHATVTVVDLVKKEHPAHPIDGFNCPMGLGILPDGSKLYVASQCGSGHDPDFVVRTGTDAIIKRIRDCAVGGEIAVASKNHRVDVSRSGFVSLDRSGNRLEEPGRISAIDSAKDESVDAETINVSGSALTVSPGGQYLFFSTSKFIEILNTETQKRSSLPVGNAATGIAVGRPDPNGSSLVLYAWVPEQKRVFFTGLDGLLP